MRLFRTILVIQILLVSYFFRYAEATSTFLENKESIPRMESDSGKIKSGSWINEHPKIMPTSKRNSGYLSRSLLWNRGVPFFFGGALICIGLRRSVRIERASKFLATMEHEVNHALFSVLFGGSVLSIGVSHNGGVAYVTKSNFIVRLAPYCVPLLCFTILLLCLLFSTNYKAIGVVSAGMVYGNFVLNAFRSIGHQPDIKSSGGKFFSYPIIFVGNTAALSLMALIIRSIF